MNNLCVAGETQILTKNGYFPIQSFENETIEIWNGTGWSSVNIKQTANRRHLITIFFSNGRSLTCAPDHKFILGDGPLKTAKRAPAQFLIPGMKLRQEDFPIIDGNESCKHAYLHAALCSFGCFTENGPILDIMGPILDNILSHPGMIANDNGSKIFPEDLPPAYSVPVNSSIYDKIQWLSGFLETRSFPGDKGVAILNINETLLQNIQLLLTTLNISSIINKGDMVKINLPDDKNIMLSNYALVISWEGISKLRNFGLVGKYEKGEIPSVPSTTSELIISDIVDIGRLSPTYSFSEEINNAAVFNGILTGY